jgi:hypothetical protein
MHASARMPGRTEDEVRAALVALEYQAPSAETVLGVVRAAGPRRGRGLGRPRRSSRSPRWPQLVMAVATAAAVAGLAIALLPGGPSPGGRTGRPGPATQGPGAPALPSTTALGMAMLTAFGAATGDVLFEVLTGWEGSTVTTVIRDWSWPVQPVRGHLERWRESWTTIRGKALVLAEDDGLAYIAPRAGANSVYGQLTVVCYPGAGQGGCGYASTVTPPGTWSRYTRRFGNPNLGLDDLSPRALAREIVEGQWRIIRRTHLAGQRVIELAETRRGHYRPLPALLWVNARTFLPLRMTDGAGTGQADQTSWYYLKPTAANLALLRVPIPHGYPRVR